MSFSANGQLVTSAQDQFGTRSTMALWEPRQSTRLGSPTAIPFRNGALSAPVFSLDAKTVATDTAEGDVVVTDDQGSPLARLPCAAINDGRFYDTYALSGDGGRVACMNTADVTVSVWDVATQRHVATLDERGASVGKIIGLRLDGPGDLLVVSYSPEFDPNAPSDAPGTSVVAAWNANTGELMWTHSIDAGSSTIEIAPNGAMVAATELKSVLLLDSATGELVKSLDGHAGNVQSLAFTNDGHSLAAAAADTSITVWDVAAGTRLGPPLTADTEAIVSVVFDPTGALLASSDLTGRTILWDIRQQTPVGTLTHATAFAFAAGGGALYTSGANSVIWKWSLSLDDWRSAACSIAGRNLTADEWQQFLPDEDYRKTCPAF